MAFCGSAPFTSAAPGGRSETPFETVSSGFAVQPTTQTNATIGNQACGLIHLMTHSSGRTCKPPYRSKELIANTRPSTDGRPSKMDLKRAFAVLFEVVAKADINEASLAMAGAAGWRFLAHMKRRRSLSALRFRSSS